MADTQAALQETITWYSVHDSMPDDDQTVMIRIPSPAEPTWIGFHDSNDGWHYIEGMKINYAVTHWAELPEGPKE
jgi:hypothetical protein